jgi:Fe-S cluster assembly protein SufD
MPGSKNKKLINYCQLVFYDGICAPTTKYILVTTNKKLETVISLAKNIPSPLKIQVLYLFTSTNKKKEIKIQNYWKIDTQTLVSIEESFLVKTKKPFKFSSITTFDLGEKSKLEYFQTKNHQLEQKSQFFIKQAHKSEVKLAQFLVAKKNHNNELNFELNDETTKTSYQGFYLLQPNAHYQEKIHFAHLKPLGQSLALSKGLLKKNSKMTFKGLATISPAASKTETKIINKNLLLAENASVTSEPQLEIYHDDVKCFHGSATGQLDQEALFYLSSRGIKYQEAQKMLINAFAKEIINSISDAEIAKLWEKILWEVL